MPQSRPQRARALLALLLFVVAFLVPSPAHADAGGIDPGLALWGSSAIALLFTLAGSLALAWYHRAQGALDGRITELRERAEKTEARLAATREEYARKQDLERLATLESSIRSEMDARFIGLRAEFAAQFKEIRDEQAGQRKEIGSVHADVQKILGALTQQVGGRL